MKGGTHMRDKHDQLPNQVGVPYFVKWFDRNKNQGGAIETEFVCYFGILYLYYTYILVKIFTLKDNNKHSQIPQIPSRFI